MEVAGFSRRDKAAGLSGTSQAAVFRNSVRISTCWGFFPLRAATGVSVVFRTSDTSSRRPSRSRYTPGHWVKRKCQTTKTGGEGLL